MATSPLAGLDVLVVGGIYREVIERSGAADVRIGGSALTAAIAASRMGASVAAAGFVGAEDIDVVGMQLVHAGVREELVVLPGASGFFVYPTGSDDTQPRPQYRPAETSPIELRPLPQARTILVFGMPDFDPTSDAAVRSAASCADVLVWDRQGWLSRTRDAYAALALEAKKRVVLTNVDEAIDEGVIDLETGLIQVPDGYVAAVIKDGPHGALVADGSGEHKEVCAYPVEVDSNLGSGDVFAGVFAAEVSAGMSLADAAANASAATSALLQTGETFAPSDLRELMLQTAGGDGVFLWRWPINGG